MLPCCLLPLVLWRHTVCVFDHTGQRASADISPLERRRISCLPQQQLLYRFVCRLHWICRFYVKSELKRKGQRSPLHKTDIVRLLLNMCCVLHICEFWFLPTVQHVKHNTDRLLLVQSDMENVLACSFFSHIQHAKITISIQSEGAVRLNQSAERCSNALWRWGEL